MSNPVFKCLASAALAFTFMTTPTLASPPDNGNEWTANCLSNNPRLNMRCYAYARGLADGFNMTDAVCIDEKVTAQQLVDVGILYIRNHPVTRAQWAGDLLMGAFAEAWPCKSERRR